MIRINHPLTLVVNYFLLRSMGDSIHLYYYVFVYNEIVRKGDTENRTKREAALPSCACLTVLIERRRYESLDSSFLQILEWKVTPWTWQIVWMKEIEGV